MKEDQNIEDLFRTSFDNFEVTPPSSVKAAVDSEIRNGKHKRIWWISSIVLLLLMTTGGWMLYTFSTDTEKLPTQTAQQSSRDNLPGGESNKNAHTDHLSSETSRNSVAGTKGDQADSLKKSTDANTTSHAGKTEKQSSTVVSPKNKRPTHNRERVSHVSNKKTNKLPFQNDRKFNDYFPPGDDHSGNENVYKGAELSGNERNGSVNKMSGKQARIELQSPLTSKLSELSNEAKTANNAPESQVSGIDSTADSGNDKNKKPSGKNWLASVYAGPQWGINNVTDDPAFELSEKTSMYFSAEINRNLFSGFGVTSGLGYTSRKETMFYNQFTYDSLYIGQDSTPVYGNPNFPDSITGYSYFNVYQIDTTKTQQIQANSIQTVAVPLFITRHFSFTEKWGMLVNAGAVFRFNTFKTGNAGPAPLTNAFTVSPAIRVHLTYSLDQWMFSLGVSGGIDLKQPLVYDGFDRKRSYLTPQFGMHFRF